MARITSVTAWARLWRNHALSWTAVGAAAAAVVVACFLPAVRLGISAYVGAGAAQRTFDYDRTLSVVGGMRPAGLLLPVAGLVLLALAATAVVLGSRAWLVLASAAVSLSLLLGVGFASERTTGDVGRGVIGFEHPHAGVLLQPALDDLHRDARRSPEAQEPGYTLLGGPYAYRAERRTGWELLQQLSVVLALLTVFRALRLRLRPVAAAAVLTALTFAVLVVLVLRALSSLE